MTSSRDLSPVLLELFKQVPEGARVLDLGCGEGKLLKALKDEKKVRVQGLEINLENINACIAKGVPVIQADLNNGLGSFPDQAFDIVILSETLQVIQDPSKLLLEIMRIGKMAVIGVLNIGYWKSRTQLLFTGRMPMGKNLPHQWHNTPNIHLGTLKDFKALCAELKIELKKEIPIQHDLPFMSTFMPNLLAQKSIYIISKEDQ